MPSLDFLAIICMFTTLMAYFSIRKGNVKLHKQFMIRSYVCGFALVFIKLLPELNYLTGIFNFMEATNERVKLQQTQHNHHKNFLNLVS